MKSKSDLMKVLVKSFFYLTCCAVLLGCGLFSKEKNTTALTPERESLIIGEFERANDILDQKEYGRAAEMFDALIDQSVGTSIYPLAIYNSGVSHLSGGNCQMALNRFRQAIRVTQNKVPTIRSRATVSLAEVYTCLGNDRQAMIALVEVMKNPEGLPAEIIEAQVPAKLATAYARNGNREMADKYFQIAERGLNRLRENRPSRGQRNEVLARTLLGMGDMRSYDTSSIDEAKYFESLRNHQRFLIQAIELNTLPYSQAAFDVLLSAYDKTWDYVDRIPSADIEDTEVAQRTQMAQRNQVVARALHTLREAKKEPIPKTNSAEIVQNLVNRFNQMESRYQTYLATQVVGTHLTPEARSREGLRREGRVRSEKTELEKAAESPNNDSKDKP